MRALVLVSYIVLTLVIAGAWLASLRAVLLESGPRLPVMVVPTPLSHGDEMPSRTAVAENNEVTPTEALPVIAGPAKTRRFEGRFSIQAVGDAFDDASYTATIQGSSLFVARSLHALANTFWDDVNPQPEGAGS